MASLRWTRLSGWTYKQDEHLRSPSERDTYPVLGRLSYEGTLATSSTGDSVVLGAVVGEAPLGPQESRLVLFLTMH